MLWGLVLCLFKPFAAMKLGESAYYGIIKKTPGTPDEFSVSKVYPDEYLHDLMRMLSKESGENIDNLRHQFGRYIGPKIMEAYFPLVRKSWKCLDFIEHMDEIFYKLEYFKKTDPKDREEFMKCVRLSKKEMVVQYMGDLKCCDVLRGSFEGFAQEYDETLFLTHPKGAPCMKKGDDCCTMYLRVK